MSKLKLSRERYSNLLEAERNLNSQVTNIDKLEECGVDCQAMRALLSEKLDQIANIKTHFGPNSSLSQE